MSPRRRSTWILPLTTLLSLGCSDGPASPMPPDLAAVGGPPVQPIPWVSICHVDTDGTLVPQSVPGVALNAHLGHGDVPWLVGIPAGATFSASNSIVGDPQFFPDRTPQLAFDGRLQLGWNAGTFPTQWIEVDLGSPQAFRRILALVDQTPSPGTTVHEVALDGNLAHTWSGTTVVYQWLDHDFGATVQAQRVRITTTTSPSWVAWFEIRLARC